jgi:hypothetical protein
MADLKSPPFAVTPYTSSKFILFGILQPVAVLCVGLRFWVRKPTLSDWLILVALISSTGLVAALWTSCIWAGSGIHTEDIEEKYRSRVFVTFTVAQPVWGLATTAVKLSIIHLYMNMFPSPKFRRVCYATMTVTTLYFLSVIVETFAFCKPVQFTWDKTVNGSCAKNANIGYIIAALSNLLIDVVVVAMPIPIVWSLRMPIKKKRGIIGIFSMGAMICILSILRTVNVTQIDFPDFHHYIHSLEIWSAIEPTLGIIVACMPVLRPAFTRISKSPLLLWSHRSTELDEGSSEENLTRSRNFRSITQRSDKGQFQRIEDPVDRMYPLCDIKAGEDGDARLGQEGVLVEGQQEADKNVRITTTITTSSQSIGPGDEIC